MHVEANRGKANCKSRIFAFFSATFTNQVMHINMQKKISALTTENVQLEIN